LALKWLYLALNGFVFYRQNRHFTSVKSGDSCILKLALFRNFMFFSQPCASVDTFLNSRALQSFTKLNRRLGGGQGRVLSRRSRAKADATLLACAAGTLWPGHPAPFILHS